ncbi:MAG: tRNA (adenosine(37)-N6)-dimethylallyltransferase MiaA [Oscillospiraceae bacterium]|nr:tRNA (adenosine(37)-N6)-dimethylallyltransferase MiaA [Oscillospiraceae bacterium]
MAEYSKTEPGYMVICGPTACGKSALAARAAALLGGEVVCGDSMQIYRGLEIGTAAPTEEERALAPHHLYGFLEPSEGYSVARYVEDARAAVLEISARGRLPIICGGTGLYIDSLCGGVNFLGAAASEQLRAEVRAEYERGGLEPLLAELERADRDFVKTLDKNNIKRVLRAVELLRSSGITTAGQTARSRENGSFGRAKKFFLNPSNRAALYERCERRVDEMLARGLLEEARQVFEKRESYKTAAQAIGYKEFFPYFMGESSLEECAEALKRATRRYAKRQLTWFKRSLDAVEIDIDSNSPERALEILAKNSLESL